MPQAIHVKDGSEKFRFTVDSALLGELGEKLVSTVHVALSELVKNSYDADATEVRVDILPEEDYAPKIIVEDDGEGMTLEQVRRFWMKIGTANKQDDPLTKRFGRLKTGSKGVGRFACRRLGLKLKLHTVARLHDASDPRVQHTEVVFDWNDFVPGTDVEVIDCVGQSRVEASGTTGTRLEISGGLEDEWRRTGFDYLRRQLAILASRNGAQRDGFEDDPGFNVLLHSPEFAGKVIDVREEIIDATWGTLSAEVQADGRIACTLKAHGIGGVKRFTSAADYNLVKGAKLKLGIMPDRKEDARKPEVLSKYAMQEISEWGGVHVRFNGFRMFPYGSPRDDWLEIDKDRGRRLGRPSEEELFDFASTIKQVDAGRVLLNMLSMRSYYGYVDADTTIAGLIPRIDRQGFIENPAFEQLRKFARFCIDWANIHREYYIRVRNDEEAAKALRDIEPVLDQRVTREELVPHAATYLKSEIRRIIRALPDEADKKTEAVLLRTIKAIETTNESNQHQLQHLRLIASASTLTLLFAHEIRTVIGSLGATSVRLQQIAKKLSGENAKALTDVAEQVVDIKSRFDDLVEMTGMVGAFKRQDQLTKLHLKAAIDRTVRCFQLINKNYHLEIDLDDVPGGLVVGPMVEGELFTILINLFSNSVKSVIAAGRRKKKIRFEAIKENGKVSIKVIDNGVGLDPSFFDEVFTPFIADPTGDLYDQLSTHANSEDSHVFGTGSGLGLAIVRDIVSARGGTVKFITPPEGWNACVEVMLK